VKVEAITMKKNIKLGLSILGLVLCLASCGKSGNNSGNYNTQDRANQITAICQGNPQCIESQLRNQYGAGGQYPGQYGAGGQPYYQGMQNFGGQQYQQYQVPYYQNNCSPCQQQNFYANQQGAFYGRPY
jgi:hypothetical protein